MPYLGTKSKRILATICPELQLVLEEAIKFYDFKVISGQRGEAEQNELFENNYSKKRYPDSRHNTEPLSDAVDLAPYPVDWNDAKRFAVLAGIIMYIAWTLEIEIRWGGDWDGDTRTTDQTFNDLGHFEIVRSRE